MEEMDVDTPRMAGRHVRDRRVSLGLTQKDLAKMSGVSTRTIINLELGIAPGIRMDKLMSILRALNLRVVLKVDDRDKSMDAEIASFLEEFGYGDD